MYHLDVLGRYCITVGSAIIPLQTDASAAATTAAAVVTAAAAASTTAAAPATAAAAAVSTDATSFAMTSKCTM